MSFLPCAYRVSAKVCLIQEDSLLLISEHGQWDLPGGGIEHSETPLQALQREVHEELGIVFRAIEKAPVSTWTLYDEEYQWPLLFLVYKATPEQILLEQDLPPEAAFFTKSELGELEVAPYLEQVRKELIQLTESQPTYSYKI